jgi:hypothetical protein
VALPAGPYRAAATTAIAAVIEQPWADLRAEATAQLAGRNQQAKQAR